MITSKQIENKIGMRSIKIPLNEITYASTAPIDTIGRVFFWKGRIFRGIFAEQKSEIEKLFRSGLIADLVENKYFVASKITTYTVDGYSLIVEHDHLPVSYPYEWSFEMFRDAGLCVLRLNEIARNYGYQTKDSHGYNVLFLYGQPMFVDLGSFVPIKKGTKSWLASEEFIRYYEYPLSVWSDGYEHIARQLIANPIEMLSHLEYYRLKSPLLRLLPGSIFSRFSSGYFSISRLSSISDEVILLRLSKYQAKIALFLKQKGLLPFQYFSFDKHKRKILGYKLGMKGYWGNYQGYKEERRKITVDSRFERISGKLKKLRIHSVADLAGNQGIISRYLLQEKIIESAYCVDYDGSAIDSLYRSVKNTTLPIQMLVQNFIFPTRTFDDLKLSDRVKVDALLVLAVTHHLALTQGIPFSHIFSCLHSYNSKYVFVEFMPLGLFNGKDAPTVPSWYNQENFRDEFVKLFKIVDIEKVAENRILFIGEKL